MTDKKRFGKADGDVAYHGYQSFQSGEVTAEEAHNIGYGNYKAYIKTSLWDAASEQATFLYFAVIA